MDVDDTDDGSTHAGGPTGGSPLDAGVAQFQQAALDAVGAARALLDAAESVIREPAAIEAMVQTVVAFARTATETVAGFAANGTTDAAPATPGRDEGTTTSGVERIRVD